MRKFLDILCFVFLSSTICMAQSKESNLKYVDPMIGGVAPILEPTRPIIHLPNQMIRMTPMRRDLTDEQVICYPLTMAAYRIVYIFGFLPQSGTDPTTLWEPQILDHEVIKPWRYNARLSGCNLSFAPNKKSGLFCISFDSNHDNYLRFTTITENGEYTLKNGHTITGSCLFNGMHAYLWAESDCTMAFQQYHNSDNRRNMLISFTPGTKKVRLRYALSYISIDQARENLRHEIKDFDIDRLSAKAKNIWRKNIDQIKVNGGTVAHKRIFYSALYRCQERMVDINEYGHYFSAYSHMVHNSDKPFYVDNWAWDTFNALEPLKIILKPELVTDEINSYIDMYRQSGQMPSFAQVFGDWPAMIGEGQASWMCDAWYKGLRFDLKTAYSGLRKNSLEETLLPWRNGPAHAIDRFYYEHGYMPCLRQEDIGSGDPVDSVWDRRQEISVTMQYSSSDWCLKRLADALGYKDDSRLFLQRAANYRNIFRIDKGMIWAKDKRGNWIESYDPNIRNLQYFTENNGYTYTWDVRQDIHGLINLMGGRKIAERKLDSLFHMDIGVPKFIFFSHLPDASGLVGQFAMGNEPSFHIPYLYDYVGAPWKTQKRIHLLIDTFFPDCLMGIPGDEDGGAMSAFVVFSMLGFYPVTPGIPVYAIGSPFFETSTIHLPSGKEFTVRAVNFNEQNKYIQSANLNGRNLMRCWFTHDELLKGGTLELVMGDEPNKNWGAREQDSPPSNLNYTGIELK